MLSGRRVVFRTRSGAVPIRRPNLSSNEIIRLSLPTGSRWLLASALPLNRQRWSRRRVGSSQILPATVPAAERQAFFSGGRNVARRFAKALLVGAERSGEVTQWLARAGCAVTSVADGTAAVQAARRETFDLAIIVSTGETMDLLETLFNLRDINDPMEIVIVTDHANMTGGLIGQITANIRNTTIINLHGLEVLLELPQAGSLRGGGP